MMKLIYFKRLKLNQTNLWPYKRQKKKSWTKLLTIKKKTSSNKNNEDEIWYKN
jgi:hypothetical protein